MRVAHLNVRLSEGGAAKVALDLHRRIADYDIESRFVYGYGPALKASPVELTTIGAVRATNPLSAALNFAVHRVVGIEVFLPEATLTRDIIDTINWADIVHVHVLHSYYLPFHWLLQQLATKKKIVIWTVHDHWLVTGRCAFTDGCQAWRTGCGQCVTMTNYPPAKFDLSRRTARQKRFEVNQLAGNLTFISPTKFIAEDIRTVYPNIPVKVIPNGLDLDFENCLERMRLGERSRHQENRRSVVLVIANDLSYPGKTDHHAIHDIIESNICEVHTVGKNSPFTGDNVINHGEIPSREELIKIIAQSDLMLFTSVVDSFGLVMIESLAAGTPVLAVDSAASTEVLSQVDGRPVKRSELKQIIEARTWPLLYGTQNNLELMKRARSSFSGDKMMRQYVSIYQEMISINQGASNG